MGSITQQDVEVKVFQEFLQSYNRLTQECFTACVNDFESRKLSDKETACGMRCVDKYLNVTQRISQRFQVVTCIFKRIGFFVL